MLNNSTRRPGGEGVLSLAKILSFFTVMALLLSVLTVVSGQADAQESESTTQSSTTQSVAADATSTDVEVPTVTETVEPTTPDAEPSAEVSTTDTGVDVAELFDQENFNPIIDVDVGGVEVDANGVATITGTWLNGTSGVFYVLVDSAAFDDLEIVEPADGAELLRDELGEVIGFAVDTDLLGSSGDFEVTASFVGEGANANFVTSDESEPADGQDVAIDFVAPEIATFQATEELVATAQGFQVGFTLENSDTPGEKLEIGDHATLTGTWVAPDGVEQGNAFSFTIPEVFAGGFNDFELAGDPDSFGTCTVEGLVVTCEMSETVNELQEVNGTFILSLRASAATADEAVSFDLDNGSVVTVDLPGDGTGIGTISPLPTEITKNGGFVSGGDQRTILWTVDLPGSFLNANDFSVPATFTDTPSQGQEVVAGSGRIFTYTQVNANGQAQGVTGLEGGTVTLSEQDETGTFALTVNPGEGEDWDNETVYRVTYRTQTDGLVAPDADITNNFGWGAEGIVGGNAGGPSWKSVNAVEDFNTFNWKLLAPGAEFDGNTLTITDELNGAPHEFADDMTAEDVRVTKNGNPVTSGVDLDRVDEKNIIITITDSAVRGNDVYEVTYSSFYTGDTVDGQDYPQGQRPKGSTRFANTAMVGTEGVASSVTVPASRSFKSGSFNTTPVTLGGETRPAFTTLNWDLVVSGNELQGFDDVEITDTLGANHQVCGSSGDLIERLGATVVVETLSGTRVEDADVELSATQDPDNPQRISFTLSKDDSENWNRSYRYRIDYNTCTTSGGMDPFGTQYPNDAEGSGISDNVASTVTLREGSGTGQGVRSGSFDLTKSVVGDFTEGTTFTIQVEEWSPTAWANDEAPTNTYEVNVGHGQTVSGHYPRGNGWVIKLSEPIVEVNGQTFNPEFAPANVDSQNVEIIENGDAARVTVVASTNQNVLLRNYRVPDPAPATGAVSIQKAVAGPEASLADGLEFTVDAYIGGEFYDRFPLEEGGDAVTLDGLTPGSVVTFREALPAIEGIAWGTPMVGETPLEEFSVTVGANETAELTLVNQANSQEGELKVRKQVSENLPYPFEVPTEYAVTASWTVDDVEHTGAATVSSNGDAVSIIDNATNQAASFPKGTEVTLAETMPTAVDGIAWQNPEFRVTGGNLDVVNNDNWSATVTVNGNGDNDNVVTVANRAVFDEGRIEITKEVVGEQADAASSLSYPITVHIEGKVNRQYTLNGADATITVDGLVPGDVVTFTETLPESNVIAWGIPMIGETPLSEYTHTVAAGDPVEITLTNEANNPASELKVRKKLGENLPAWAQLPTEYTFTAAWEIDGQPHTGTAVTTAGNTVKIIDDATGQPASFPMGTVVTLTEQVPAASEGIEWAEPEFGYAGGDIAVTDGEGWTGTVVIGGTGPNENVVKVNNTATLADGLLKVQKSVVSEDSSSAEFSDEEFVVRASWSWGTETYVDYITVDASGTPVDVNALADDDRDRLQEDGIPSGVEVTFEEVARDEAPAGIIYTDVEWSAGAGFTDRGETATLLVSNDPTEGRLLTLRNHSEWLPGEARFEKHVRETGDYVPATEAELPEGASFEVLISAITVPEGQSLPEDFDLAVGDTIILDESNDYTWNSGMVLPHGTTITFAELTPENVPGWSWVGEPAYMVEETETNVLPVQADETVIGKVINTSVPTAPVDVDKEINAGWYWWPWNRINDNNSRFEVTLSWGDDQSCTVRAYISDRTPAEILDAENCDAEVFDGKLYLPLGTEITVEETWAEVGSRYGELREVTWALSDGEGTFAEGIQEGDPVTVTLTGERNDPVTVEVTNRYGTGGGSGGSTTPTTPTDPADPTTPRPTDPSEPTPGPTTDPAEPTQEPSEPTTTPSEPTTPPTSTPSEPNGSSGLGQCIANTSSVGNPVAWLIPIAMLAGIGYAVTPLIQPIFDGLLAQANASLAEMTPDIPAPDFGNSMPDYGNEVAGELQATINAINIELAKVAAGVPQEAIAAALVAAGVIAAGAAYEQCQEQGYIGHDFAQE